jgi:hypothetical protein
MNALAILLIFAPLEWQLVARGSLGWAFVVACVVSGYVLCCVNTEARWRRRAMARKAGK